MFFLVSGEGVTDIGAGQLDQAICEDGEFVVGPMTIIIAQIVEAAHKYSILDGACGFVSKTRLIQRASQLKTVKKQLRLPGKKQAKETRYFFNNARVLARIAKEKAEAVDDDVVAVLFRDADGTASAGRGEWQDKWESMQGLRKRASRGACQCFLSQNPRLG
jgi:HPt (histidine-containing phosphotransfer) domain-containing protein